MDDSSPILYISILLGLLAIVAFFLFKQILKTTRIEKTFSKLQNKLTKEKGTAQEYYELGSIYLDKKLFVQAIQLLQKALTAEKKLEPENKALVYNALGFAYFSQEQYDLAIRNYKEAIAILPDYITVLNNLGNTYEKKQLINLAIETYQDVLKYDDKNVKAKKRLESLQKRIA